MRTLVSIFIALCAFAAVSQEPLLLRMGTVSFRIPSTWHFEGANQRVEGRGPNGEGVIANYRVLKPGAPKEVVDHLWKVTRGFAAEKLPDAASKNGEVVRPLAETTLPEGRTQFSTVTQGKKTGRDYYFLQYVLGSSRMMLFITVEGYGNALDAAARFEQLLSTQQWDE